MKERGGRPRHRNGREPPKENANPSNLQNRTNQQRSSRGSQRQRGGRTGHPNGAPSQRSSPANGARTNGYAPYWTPQEVEAKLASGQCFSGTLRVNPKGGEGYISLRDLPHDVMFRQGGFQNRAMVGDVVAFRVLPSSYWWIQKSVPPGQNAEAVPEPTQSELASLIGPIRRLSLLRREIRAVQKQRSCKEVDRVRLPVVWDHVESAEEAKQLFNEVIRHFPELKPTAEIVRILQPSPRRSALVGVLQADFTMAQRYCFLPLDPVLPPRFWVDPLSLTPDLRHLMEEAQLQEKENRTLIRATFLKWDMIETLPTVAVKEVIGASGDIETETTAILSSNQVMDQPFSQEALECLPDRDWKPSEEDLEGRLDFREQRAFSIDPPTARDLDDALSVEKLEEGMFRVGVHIADVSHFVEAGSALDHEAQSRTTSVYLVQRVIPMLPELLSSHLCSLQPGEDRLTFSVVWEMDQSGQISKQEIQKTIIHSCAKLAYAHAQTVIEDASAPQPEGVTIYGGHSWEEMKSDILSLFEISQCLRAKRQENGALRLDLPKISFRLDAKGLPETAEPSCQKEANHLIQEFMLLANMSVAKYISDMYPSHSLLRCHPPPNLRLMGDLLEVAEEMKVDLDVTTAATIQKGLWQLYQKCRDADVIDAITNLATRPMQLAEYFCTGLAEKEKWSHYALAVESYTHFTSPIRRYPDVIVHRLLSVAITQGETFSQQWSRDETFQMQSVAEACNRGKLSARNAQEASLNLYLRYWLEKKPVETLGVVASVKGAKFFDVYVPQFAISTRIQCDDLPGRTTALFDKETSTLTILKAEDIKEPPQHPIPVRSVSSLVTLEKRSPRISAQLKCHEPSVALQFEIGSAKGDRDSQFVHVTFSYTPESVSLTLSTPEATEKLLRTTASLNGLSSLELPAEVDYGERPMAPLQYPFQVSRFSKVPIKVWVKRNVTLGVIKDVEMNLIVAED